MSDQTTQSSHRLRRIDVTLRPASRFPVPVSDGYSVYSSLLNALSTVDETVGAHVHDTEFGSLHCSGLRGTYRDSERAHHKTVTPDETYGLTLGIADPDDREIFQALVDALVLSGDTLELSHGTLRVESFESANASHEQLLDEAASFDDPAIEMSFETATCIEEAGDVTTMFPHRVTVFTSLLGKWNQSCPDQYELDVTRDELARHVIEKPDARTYDTHSVLVNRVENEDGETRNLFRQGFTGVCGYAFKGASESVVNAVTALALFGEYSGVGSAVARGCGSLEVNI
jgi:CRISPR-associated endoribonuclease Cas6